MKEPTRSAHSSTRRRRPRATVAPTDPLRFLNLYRIYHQLLGADEREALARVEVAENDYLQVAADMQRTPEEIRALVFEARRKLLLGMAPTLVALEDAPAG